MVRLGSEVRIQVWISHMKGKLAIQFYLIFQTGHGRFAIHDDLLILNNYSTESEIYMIFISIFQD